MSGAFLQSNLWTLLKGSFGWEPYTFHYDGKVVNVLLRYFFKFFPLAYVPYAPVESDRLEEFSKKLRGSLTKVAAAFALLTPYRISVSNNK